MYCDSLNLMMIWENKFQWPVLVFETGVNIKDFQVDWEMVSVETSSPRARTVSMTRAYVLDETKPAAGTAPSGSLPPIKSVLRRADDCPMCWQQVALVAGVNFPLHVLTWLSNIFSSQQRWLNGTRYRYNCCWEDRHTGPWRTDWSAEDRCRCSSYNN